MLNKPPFSDIKHFQRFSKGMGLYLGAIDGIGGPLTSRAANSLERISRQISDSFGVTADDRTVSAITTLNPLLQGQCWKFLIALKNAGIDGRVISGMRSYFEQDKLYAQGRSIPGDVITNARGGFSIHNFGLAFDIGIFKDGKYLGESMEYLTAAHIGREIGLECGAFWKTFQDKPHYQWVGLPATMILREKFERGEKLI